MLELRRVPDHSILARTCQRPLRRRVLDPMLPRFLDALKVAEGVIAADSTGYATTQASADHRSCSGRVQHEFHEGFYAV